MTTNNFYKASHLVKEIERLKSILEDIQLLLDNWDKKAIKCTEKIRSRDEWDNGYITDPFYKMSFLYFDKRYEEMSYEELPVPRDAVRVLLETTKSDVESNLANAEKELEAL